ncbi:MAG: hypothetical protein JW966_07300 [Anaerolineae bacterium]|nr:hypothetical protein [Anaerolineae bacterium]
MSYYPDMTIIQGMARIQRERRLPPNVVPDTSSTLVSLGMPTQAMQIVLQGDMRGEYRILDVGKFFKVRDPDEVETLIQVHPEQRVQFGQELARRGRGRRAKVLQSPADGEVVRIERGQIILQVSERHVEILARVPGDIEDAEARAVQIVTRGAAIQCAWGNGQSVFGPYQFLPEDGFFALSKMDVSISEYRNVVVISTAPVSKGDLLVARQQEAWGVVAPSMPSDLREFAMQLKFPVLLTEGFGQRRPTSLIYNLLQTNIGRTAAFDAVTPDPWSTEQPEIVIPLPSGSVTPPTPALDQPLQVGTQVRIVRRPWEGFIGEVVELPPKPQVIENGLQVRCARVQLSNSRVEVIPLANLELLGQSVGRPPIDQL